ncbi:MAG: sigma-70 family RNA polymerase sigma factor [Planctomycetes bacterium]|nr:sigma-70 family RNA polymerase sigma factor [Planctomycetota bacterium]
MHTEYMTPIIRQLRDQQVRFAPREKKLEQVNRAERLLNEIDPSRVYSYEYLCYRITDYRPDAPTATMPGAQVRHDLRLFVEDVSDSADISPEEAGEPVHTMEDLSQMFNVSLKTIQRWRDQGLVSRRFLFGGRKRVGFLRSSVDRFVARNKDKVERGERFSQLTDAERDSIIERARRLAQAGGCPSEVARRIAKHMGRSFETVRYTIKQFDEKNPTLAVFPLHTGPLSVETREKIYQQFRRGASVDALAKKYCRTRTSIYRVINEMRAHRILQLPLSFVPNEIFSQRSAEKEIMAPLPGSSESSRKSRAPSGLPSYLASLYEVPLLTREQEYHLFRQFNFLKYKAARLREGLIPAEARTSVMDEIESLYNQAIEIKNRLVQANLRLVISIAKRHVSGSDDFFGLVSDGNMSLIRAVEKFDYSRGNKFSTYASWAIMKNFARTIPEEFRVRDRFRTSQEAMFSLREDDRSDHLEQERAQSQREQQISRILSCLDDRERQIIVSRFGLNHSHEPQTLKEVGAELGITKERVRQLEARGLDKLREAARTQQIDPPG